MYGGGGLRDPNEVGGYIKPFYKIHKFIQVTGWGRPGRYLTHRSTWCEGGVVQCGKGEVGSEEEGLSVDTGARATSRNSSGAP